MRLPGINSDFAWRVYIALTRAECEWRERHGFNQQTQVIHVREPDGCGRLQLVAIREVPPRHPVYGRLIEFMFWLGLVPFALFFFVVQI